LQTLVRLCGRPQEPGQSIYQVLVQNLLREWLPGQPMVETPRGSGIVLVQKVVTK
jgi:hypothetical protein